MRLHFTIHKYSELRIKNNSDFKRKILRSESHILDSSQFIEFEF